MLWMLLMTPLDPKIEESNSFDDVTRDYGTRVSTLQCGLFTKRNTTMRGFFGTRPTPTEQYVAESR